MYKCPVTNCNHVGGVLTNNHCKATHGMTKEQVIEQYGKPMWLKYTNYKNQEFDTLITAPRSSVSRNGNRKYNY